MLAFAQLTRVEPALGRCPADDGYDERFCDVVLSPSVSTVGDVATRALAELGLLATVPSEHVVVWKSFKEVSELDLALPITALCGSRSECEATVFANHGVADGRMWHPPSLVHCFT